MFPFSFSCGTSFPAPVMAQKRLRITSPNGDEIVLDVEDTTTIREISQQCHEGGPEDREANLIRGVTLLEPKMTVSEAGLEDGDDLSLVWNKDPFVEMEKWTGEKVDQDLCVRIPPHVTHIEAKAFEGCTALVKVVIPESVTSIGDGAFAECSSLMQVEIPDSVTRIGEMSFEDCHSLTLVTIPNSVTSIAWRAFANCSR